MKMQYVLCEIWNVSLYLLDQNQSENVECLNIVKKKYVVLRKKNPKNCTNSKSVILCVKDISTLHSTGNVNLHT